MGLAMMRLSSSSWRRLLATAAVSALALVAVDGCASPKPVKPVVTTAPPAPPPPPPPTISTAPLPVGLDEAALDRSVKPCDDFYAFACGTWMKNTEIPADRSSTSRGFVSIAERNELLMKDILERATKGEIAGDDGKKLGDHYQTCMDEPKLETSLAQLKKDARLFKTVKNGKSLAAVVAKMHLKGQGALFSMGAMQDLKDAKEVVFGLYEGGLGMPDRDYYLNDDEKTAKVRELYKAHVVKMLVLAGDKEAAAQKKMETIFALEKKLAESTRTKVEKRDIAAMYHRLDKAGTKKLAPLFSWDFYMAGIGQKKTTAWNIAHPAFFETLNGLVKTTKPAEWAAYLEWVQLRSSIPALPKAMQDAQFAYESEALTGAKEDRPRWKKCVALADSQLGEALGKVFVAEQFGEEGKTRTLAMVKAVEAAFEANLDNLSWMDEPTRAEARTKAKGMKNKIGYPDVWRDYGPYKTSSKSFLQNYVGGVTFEVKRDLAKIGKPVDPNEWYMSPPTVNAYNDGQMNEIVFPAGILQPPFFNKDAPDAVNFGAMGMVVGHEITHGFDDEGRKLDSTGNLRDWWSEASGKAFEERTKCVEKQFDDSIALEDIHVIGALTLGENTADLGGLKMSLLAMSEWQKTKPAAADSPYTPEQLFFLGYAQSWCSKYRPEAARVRAKTDPHAPPFLRVNNPLKNLPAFQEAFFCQAGDPMVKADACEVW